MQEIHSSVCRLEAKILPYFEDELQANTETRTDSLVLIFNMTRDDWWALFEENLSTFFKTIVIWEAKFNQFL